MSYGIKQIFRESKIKKLIAGFNKNLLLCFYASRTYGIFKKVNSLFKNVILKNSKESIIIKLIEKAFRSIGLKDVGLFIFLVVIFNTVVMIVFKKEIDIFSISARMLFSILGVVLIVRGQVSSSR